MRSLTAPDRRPTPLCRGRGGSDPRGSRQVTAAFAGRLNIEVYRGAAWKSDVKYVTSLLSCKLCYATVLGSMNLMLRERAHGESGICE